MKVLYDSQIFDRQKYGGISRYFRELIHRLRLESGYSVELPLLYTWNGLIAAEQRPLLRSIPAIVEKHQFRGRYRVVAFLERSSRRLNVAAIRRGTFDIFHPTYYDPYFLDPLGSRPFVITVHDMMHELFPSMYTADDETTSWKRLLVEKARKVIAISHNTKRDLVRLFHVPEEKVEVIYHGCSEFPPSMPGEAPPLPTRYVLFMGERIRYKNFRGFLRASLDILREDSGLKIACVGGGGLTAEEVSLFDSLGISSRVVHCTIDDDSLPRFYRHAECLVYPSLYEGFGLPVIEAFYCGCPVAASNTSSIPEIAGDAAVLFDPEDDVSMQRAIRKVLYDQSVRGELKMKGDKQWRAFTWDDTARRTRVLYDAVVA